MDQTQIQIIIIGVIILVLALLIILLEYASIKTLFSIQDCVPLDGEDNGIRPVLERLAKRAQMPCPKIFLLLEFSPNAFAIRTRRVREGTVVLSEGLLSVLKVQELEAVLCLLLAQLKVRGFRYSAIAAQIVMPLVILSEKLPGFLQVLTLPIVGLVLRIFVRPAQFYKMDALAKQFNQDPLVLAAALQKIEKLSTKIPLQSWNYAMGHFFIVPTCQEEETFVFPFALYPSVQARVHRLLHNS